MTGSMSEKCIFLPNRKTIMRNLVLSGLENMIKIKVMKKWNNLPVQKIKMYKKGRKISTSLV